MSDGKEVKRWKITAAQWDNPKSEWRFKDSVGPGFDGYDSPSPTIEVMPVAEHDSVVAELRAEVEQWKSRYQRLKKIYSPDEDDFALRAIEKEGEKDE